MCYDIDLQKRWYARTEQRDAAAAHYVVWSNKKWCETENHRNLTERHCHRRRSLVRKQFTRFTPKSNLRFKTPRMAHGDKYTFLIDAADTNASHASHDLKLQQTATTNGEKTHIN